MLKADRRPSEKAIEIHRDGPVQGQTQRVIAVTPIFDEGDIGRGLGSGHGVMIPLSSAPFRRGLRPTSSGVTHQ
jgi:hypothetical protein